MAGGSPLKYMNYPDQLAGYQYRVWHDTFFQPNPVQAEQMIDIALEYAGLTGFESVLDLFYGVGTFSLPLADQAKELTGIELVESSIESAKRNAKDNGLSNTRFIARDARRGLAELQDTISKLDLILLDPP